ncbi:hypothetical protein SAY87_030754 [Trapa incisa]|uniref:Glycine-rich protein n=1 Tax=Trapa incisa TaxID=236973 RepID=A0AAN7QK20_9MYRT|nr:hypothetical protein SAY87_030754 [Trapa incisa]
MSPRVLLLLGLLAAIVLLLASEGTARDLAEKTSTDDKKDDGVTEAKYGWYPGGGYPGGGYPGGGYPGGGYPGGGYPGGGYPGWRRCYWGCCGYGYYGRCRCCASAAEAAQKSSP